MFEFADVVAGVDPGPRPSVHDVSTAIDEAVALQAQIDALEGRKLLAVERARRAAAGCERALLDETALEARRASARRRRELAVRAFTADLATALRMSEQQASHLVDTARILTDATDATDDVAEGGAGPVPPRSTLVELCRGRFSAAHARLMADTLGDLPDHDARVRVQGAALPAASRTTLAQFRRRLRRARDLAHPLPLTTRHRQAATRRAVHLDPGADGMAWLTAYLPAPGAHAAYDRLTRTARTATTAGDGRTVDQLRADALVDLLLTTTAPTTTRSGMPTGALPADGRSRSEAGDELGAERRREHVVPGLAGLARRITPSVRVTVPVTALLGADDPAELDGHGPVDADTAARLTASAPSLRRLLVDPVDGRVLTTDPGTYAVPAALRALLQARDTTCRFPGCTRAATRCDLDHVVAWSGGGTTTAGNLTHLCRRHHTAKHQTAWRVAHGPAGALSWTSPTGRTHHDHVVAPLDPPALDPPGFALPVPDPPAFDRPVPDPPAFDRPVPDPPAFDRPVPDPPAFDRPVPDPPALDRPVPDPPPPDAPGVGPPPF